MTDIAAAERLGPMRRLLSARIGMGPAIAGVLALAVLVISVIGPLVLPHDPIAGNLSVRLLPPAFMESGRIDYPLGTDDQGRDILSRIIAGAGVSLSIAAISIGLGCIVGTTLGLIGGFLGGWTDAVITRAADVALAFPSVLIALLFAVAFGPSYIGVVAVVALVLWARYARLVRGEVLALRERDFVALAKVAGASPARIVVRHIIPNAFDSIVVLSTLQIGFVIILEASLSFLGAGVPDPTPSWGKMVADGRVYFDAAWWMWAFPGIAIVVVVLTFNVLGDWLRSSLNPRLRNLAP